MKNILVILSAVVLTAVTGCSNDTTMLPQQHMRGVVTASAVTIHGADAVDPKIHVMKLLVQLNKGGYTCSNAASVKKFSMPYVNKPDSWIMGPATIGCLHRAETQINVDAYNNSVQRVKAGEFLANNGTVYVSGPDWDVAIISGPGTDAKLIAAAMSGS